MDRRIVLVAFNGEPMCFVHALLNVLDMEERGFDARLVIEGSATRLVEILDDESVPFAGLYHKVRDKGLIDCVCRACAAKMGALEAAEAQRLPLCEEMSGHPSLARYIELGCDVITF